MARRLRVRRADELEFGPHSLPVPTLVLAGLGDRLTNPACSIALARKHGADISLHPSAGHDLTVDAPEWASEQVTVWLDHSLGMFDLYPCEELS